MENCISTFSLWLWFYHQTCYPIVNLSIRDQRVRWGVLYSSSFGHFNASYENRTGHKHKMMVTYCISIQHSDPYQSWQSKGNISIVRSKPGQKCRIFSWTILFHLPYLPIPQKRNCNRTWNGHFGRMVFHHPHVKWNMKELDHAFVGIGCVSGCTVDYGMPWFSLILRQNHL